MHVVHLTSMSDQHQNSPCTMNVLKNKLVMRIKDMITQDESLLLQQILSTTSIGNAHV